MIAICDVGRGLERLESVRTPTLLDRPDQNALGKVEEEFSVLTRKLNVDCHLVFPEDSGFPGGLLELKAKDAIKGLVAIGNIDLLKGTMVGICGSRKATDRGLEVSRDVCGDLARDGAIIVSGYAAGVDESAHHSALESGGATICVLAEGMNHFRIKRSLRDVWDWNRCLVITQFGFSAIWQAGRAMHRNKTIVGMSKATLVVEARDTGGTLDAGFTALRMGRPLLVVDYAESATETAGNKLLLENGGIPFRKKRSTGAPSMVTLSKIIGSRH